MHKTLILLSAALLMLASTQALDAASLAGVSLPDTATVGGKSLVLNGLGLRSEFMVKVYVAGLYLEQKSTDPDAIIKAEAPKRIVMHFLHDASQKQMTVAFSESFQDNSPQAGTTMKAEIDKFLGALEPLKVGDEMVFTYLPATGTTVAINSKEKVTISGQAFSQVLLSVWLGPKPPTASLKKGMLGQKS
jgi:Chalcone isomerase-like